MVATADSVKDKATDREELPVSPGFTDLPAFKGKEAVDKLATETRWARREVDATVSALREKITADHMKRYFLEKIRESSARPEAQKKAVVVLSIIALISALAIVVVPRIRRKGAAEKT